ncbi:hypothetical protein [Runella sp.]
MAEELTHWLTSVHVIEHRFGKMALRKEKTCDRVIKAFIALVV